MPVDLPTQLAVGVGQKIEVTAVTATAGVVCLGAIIGELGDGGEVGVTFGAEDADGIIIFLLCVVFCLDLLRRFVGILGLEGVKDFKNLAALLQGFENILGVSACTVELALIAAIQLDAELFHCIEEFFLKVLCVVLMASPRVGNIDVGTTDIFVVAAADDLLYVCGNLAATVEFIPREEQLCFLSLFLKSLHDEQGGGDVAEVADVHRTRGADACGADVFFFIRIALNNFLSNLI